MVLCSVPYITKGINKFWYWYELSICLAVHVLKLPLKFRWLSLDTMKVGFIANTADYNMHTT